MEAKGAAPALGVGTVVAGKYRVERTLAEGGMGLVVAAMHLHLGQTVALKFLREDRGGDVDSQWDSLARFRAEAKAVAQLRSEHVAHVLDAGLTDDGTPYMVLEYLEGCSLALTLQMQGPLDVETATEYVIHACEGLAEAHAHGIVHRDIKPQNLFLVERSGGWHAVKIVDFGISKFAFSDTANVVTGVIVGSPCYMSPEQLRSTATVDHRSDIWSLGATLHELLAGRAAFDASQTLPELVTAILERPAPALNTLRPEVPDGLADVVTRCLAKDRETRFQSAGEVALALLPFAPPRARVPAERAASMKPAFPTTAPVEDPSRERLTSPRDSITQPDAPSPSAARTVNGPSLTPVTMPATGRIETPTPPPLTIGADLARVETGRLPWDEGAPLRTPKWVVATVGAGAALLLFAVLFVARGGEANLAAKPTPQSVAVPTLTRQDAPAMLSVTLRPPEPLRPELGELAARDPSRESAQVMADGTPVAGHTTSPTSRNRAPATPARPTRHVVMVQAPPSLAQSTIQTPTASQTATASAGGEIDSAGGRLPFRPIETRDPYGMP
jgi:serine/threonine protein kinase